MITLVLVMLTVLPTMALAEPPAIEPSAATASAVRTAPLTIEEVLARIELTHPLLRATGLERAQARARILKALGAWEPKVRNEVEFDRYQTFNLTNVSGVPNHLSSGYDDLMLKLGHPWGWNLFLGIRNVFGDHATLLGDNTNLPVRNVQSPAVAVPQDLQLFYPQQMMIVGGKFNLLRGFIINEEYAEFQQAELSEPQAEIKVAQKRQDLYLAGAIQYWDWQVAVKQAEVQKQNLAVAEARFTQVEGQAKAGKVSPLDVVEVGQEVQRRREAAIAAQRQAEYEQYKLSLFLWENGEPVTPQPEWAPEFTGETPLPTEEEIAAAKVAAKEDRPEVRALAIELQMNNIDVKLAKNSLLPKLYIEGGPAIGSIYWVGGIGYRVGTFFSIPLFNREARGKVAHAQAEQERLTYELWNKEQQVSIDVDNWVSAIVRARDRVRAATEAYRLAKVLEEGERKRFDMGATSILFVNMRERNAVEAAYDLYRAQYDYVLARGGYLWAQGGLSRATGASVLAKYGDPVHTAGSSGQKIEGRD
ncbi:MAG TPA: TolC family protein [Nitrospira sp.]|nr:TolC family protein [Nitrospira sp.]